MNRPSRWLIAACRQGLTNKIRTPPVAEAFVVRTISQMICEFAHLDSSHRST
jgi:hypothetical protein